MVPDAPINLLNDPTVTDASKIKFIWDQGASSGGVPVIDYDVYYDQGIDDYILLAADVLTQYYTTTVTLTPDLVYSFKVTARNSVGDSLTSAPVSIRAAEEPVAPINLANVPAGTTAYQIAIDWDDGLYDGGSPVLDYRVSYKEESQSEFSVIASDVLDSTLIVAGLIPGTTYQFKAESRNLVGYSGFSEIVTILAAQIPDEPTDLQNVPANTFANQIALAWLAPLFDGGSPVVDYRIWYDNASGGTFEILASGVT